MRIEKISETQVKFILSKTDLDERNIKINELAYGSEKTHRLFQEMMRQAHAECNFESENTPLMVEAMPVGRSHVVIVVTKIASTAEEERPLNLLPQAHGNDLFMTHGIQEPTLDVLQTESMAIFSFDKLDDALVKVMDQSRTHLRNDILNARSGLSGAQVGGVVLSLSAALAVALGLWPRLKEYR